MERQFWWDVTWSCRNQFMYKKLIVLWCYNDKRSFIWLLNMRGFNRETVLMGSKLNEGYIHASTQFTGCELRIKVNIIKVFKKKKVNICGNNFEDMESLYLIWSDIIHWIWSSSKCVDLNFSRSGILTT